MRVLLKPMRDIHCKAEFMGSQLVAGIFGCLLSESWSSLRLLMILLLLVLLPMLMGYFDHFQDALALGKGGREKWRWKEKVFEFERIIRIREFLLCPCGFILITIMCVSEKLVMPKCEVECE